MGINVPNVLPAPWETPTDFDDIAVPEFPAGVFPEWLRGFVDEETRATQTPGDLAGMLALSALATACAGKFRMRVRDGYEEPLNVFTMTVLESGNRKSAVFRDVVRPIVDFEAEELERTKDIVDSAAQRRRVLESRLRQAEDRAAKSEPEEREGSSAEADSIRRELASHVVPTEPRLIVDDCTPERLAAHLHEQRGRLAILSPEGGDVVGIMGGRYSNGTPNLGVYLCGHAGDALRVSRMNRASVFVPRPALTLGLAVQSEVLRGLMARPGFRGRGLVGRFLYAVPRSLLGHRAVGAAPVGPAIRDAYERGLRALLRLPWGTDSGGGHAAHMLRPDREAQKVLLDFERELEPRLGEFGDLGAITDWAGKLHGAVARIAGLLHLAEHAESSAAWESPIRRSSAERAVRLGGYLIQHARAAFGLMGGDPEVEDAKYLLRWIRRAAVDAFTKREVFEATKGRFKKVVAMEPALRLVEEHHFIRARVRPKREGPGRKPSPTYEVNPIPHYSQNPHNEVDEFQEQSANRANSASVPEGTPDAGDILLAESVSPGVQP